MPDKLTQLKQITVVVADTGDIDAMQRYTPEDATTNPTLLLKAAALPRYRRLTDEAVQWGKSQGGDERTRLENISDKLAVNFGMEILKIVPGRVSTEVDARLSFDTEATLEKARKLIRMYQENGIAKNRILIKIASTWEGIQAARKLETEGINCNLTLLFGFGQAAACADAKVFLISPFVGRILDWHKKAEGKESYAPHDDPGVQSVTRIYSYYRKHRFNTVVMGASFRNQQEIEDLAGCDRLTIGPKFLDSLQQDQGELKRSLDPKGNFSGVPDRIEMDEKTFRWMLNEDPMATEKLAEGIRLFAADQVKLETLIQGF